MAPAMMVMKATSTKAPGMTRAAVYASAAESAQLKPKQVKTIVEGFMGVAATELKKSGAFKLAAKSTVAGCPAWLFFPAQLLREVEVYDADACDDISLIFF